jgi:hypothetical protein
LERQQLEHVTYFSGKVLIALQKNIFGEQFETPRELSWGNTSVIDTPIGDIGKRESVTLLARFLFSVGTFVLERVENDGQLWL